MRRQFGRVFHRPGREGWYVRIRCKGEREVVLLAGPERWHAEAMLSVLRSEETRRLMADRLIGSAAMVVDVRPRLPAGLRFAILLRDGFRCCYCGTPATEATLHVDHRRSVADGGGNDPSNLTTSCRDCNLGKGSRSL